MTPRAGRIVVVGLLLAACGPASGPASPAGGPPRLAFRATAIDLGPRFDDERPETSIGLRNVGASTLHVERVDANCGCIALGDTPKTVEPGQEVELRFQVRLAGMSGKLARQVTVRTDDPESPISRVSIDAMVRPRIELSKSLVELRPASIDDPASAEVDVHGATGEDMAGLSCSSTTSEVKVAATISGKTARVTVQTAPFIEDFTAAIVLRLGAAERVLIAKGVSARDVRAEPPRVWADGALGAKIGATKLVGREGVKWRVLSVETDRKELTAQVVDGALRVNVGVGAPAGEFKGVVIVRLEGAKPDSVRVEVASWIEEK